MRRNAALLLTACVLMLALWAAPAAAQTSYPPSVSPVEDASGHDGTAFTGDNLGGVLILGGAFMTIAAVTLVVARRRAARLEGG